jgi:hypothetical protein
MAKIVTSLAEAKARARRAHKTARAGDHIGAALFDRIYSTAVMCAEKQPDRVAATMYVRAAVCLEVLHEMKGWPSGVVAGFTSPRRSSRPTPTMT